MAAPTWIKPAAIGAVLLALAGVGFATLKQEKVAPASTFTRLDGQQVSMQSLRGKVVMVNFWATSCTTCVAEMPQMIETYNKFKGQGMEFVAVAMSYDRPDYVVNYTQTRKLPFTVAYDASGAAAKAWGDVAMTPTTFVIGKDGAILKQYVGQPDFAALHTLLQGALSKS
jgi:peroxiredoxin